MKRALALLLLPACTTIASKPQARGAETRRIDAEHALSTNEPGPPSAELTVTIAPRAREGSVQVRVASRAEVPTTWVLEDAEQTTLIDVALKGPRGPVKVKTERSGASLSITADGPVEAPLELSYAVRSKDDASGPASEPCSFVVEPDRARFCGEQVLALPSRTEPTTVRVELVPDGSFHAEAASSLGLADALEGPRRVEDLRGAAYVFGKLTTAEFRGVDGNDHAAALGYLSFDPRWIGAESASFRSSMDRFLDLRRTAEDPSVGVIIVAASQPKQPLTILRRTRGALVAADVSAPWTPSSRIRLTQLWAQRTIGGALWIGSRAEAEEARGLWFSEGMSRAAALFVLNEQGVLTPNDLANDVNSLLAEDALSPMRGASLDELAKAATSADGETRDEARKVLAVRGALLGLTVGSDGVKKTLRKLLAIGAERRADSLGYDVFLGALRDSASEEIARAFDEALRSGELTPKEDLLAPCHTPKKAVIAAFELGFELGTNAEGLRAVRSVSSGSSAERGGVRAGDVLETLDFTPGRTDVAVEGGLVRAGQKVKVRYLPRGRTAPGHEFKKAPGAPRICD